MSQEIQNPMPHETQNPALDNTQNQALSNTQNPAPGNTQNPGFKIVEHPADIGIAAHALSIEGLFEVAAEGMFSIICDTESIGTKLRKIVALREDSELKLDDLLILWLEKLLYIHETSGILFSKFEIKELKIGHGITLLKASVYGEKIDFEKHKVFTAIKSPTYHKLNVSFDSSEKRWRALVIFDV
jgi:SHS2 domain-containing protein